jgi:hypothetical protein
MDKLVYIDATDSSIQNAITWLRNHLQIPAYLNIDNEFGIHFKCGVIREPYFEKLDRVTMVFEEKDATMFLLCWS